MHPRRSQIDVVQSVGRVMRTADGKKMGYVILPVVIPSGKSPEEALGENKRFEVVWSVLNALRAHDDRMDSTINKLDMIGSSAQIEVNLLKLIHYHQKDKILLMTKILMKLLQNTYLNVMMNNESLYLKGYQKQLRHL